VHFVDEVGPLEIESVLVYPDCNWSRLAAPGEGADRDAVRLLERLDEHTIAALTVLPGVDVVRPSKESRRSANGVSDRDTGAITKNVGRCYIAGALFHRDH
jgi:hypothetical protein